MIISTGGYASFPVVLAGAFHRIPILLHEQNTIPGIVNRICQFFAKKVAISYQTTSRYFLRSKVAFTGNPVRKKILKAVASVGRQKLNLDQKRKTLLILGGSQGARRLNEIAAEMVDFFIAEDIQVIHITGRRDYDMVLSKTGNRVLDIEEAISEVKGKKRRIALRKYKLYHTFPYMYNIWDALSACDIALSRAGATAIAEIEARGIPSIIVPFPYSAEGHQQANAKVLLDAGAAVVFKEEELTAESLSLTIRSFFADRKKMNEMSSAAKKLAVLDAAKKIALIAYDILTTRGVLIKSDEKRVRTKKRKSVQ
jgi:UDP-N-acetylglucosamine--N-acetylmuramyl-(pentapeptide) pyrophosphoryl-undecaprenol N-acetylglucosamine transferase